MGLSDESLRFINKNEHLGMQSGEEQASWALMWLLRFDLCPFDSFLRL